MPQHCSNLFLGTAQLGMAYGIANDTRKPDQGIPLKLSMRYGRIASRNSIMRRDRDMVLGKALPEHVISKEVRVITKLDSSLKLIGVPNLYLIMLHREDLLSLGDNGLKKILLVFALSGRVQKIGINIIIQKISIKEKQCYF